MKDQNVKKFKFNVGDRVKLNPFEYPSFSDNVGTITSTNYIFGIDSGLRTYDVDFHTCLYNYVPEKWIELVEPKLIVLPSKIVIQNKKGKVTLLFGEEPKNYLSYSSQVGGEDEFDIDRGLAIAYYKRINSNLGDKEVNVRIEKLYNLPRYFEIVMVEFLLNQGLSLTQICKFKDVEVKKELIFEDKKTKTLHKVEIDLR